ncbi:MAG: copper chaperone PCu(A)C [Microthrixaceae bacterium]
MKQRSVLGLAALAVAALALVACGDDGDDAADTTTTAAEASEVTVSDVWARPVEDLTAKDTSAIYMVITGGDEADALLSASVPSDVAGTVELHETVAASDSEDAMDGDMTTTTMMDGDMSTTTMGGEMGGGMMSMRQVQRIDVPADGTVALEPGGYHVMLLDVQKELVPGDTIEVTLTFERAGEVTVTADVREP